MKFWTIFKGMSDEYTLLYNFQNVTYFEDLQNVAVWPQCFQKGPYQESLFLQWE